jgi:hypothetical protein
MPWPSIPPITIFIWEVAFITAYASPSDLTVNRIARISTTSASNTFEALGNGATKG